jgi:hypothetical protein
LFNIQKDFRDMEGVGGGAVVLFSPTSIISAERKKGGNFK